MGIWTLHSDTDSPAKDKIQRKIAVTIIFIPCVIIFSVAQYSWVVVDSFLNMFFALLSHRLLEPLSVCCIVPPLKMTSVRWWQNVIEPNRQQSFSFCSFKVFKKLQNTSSLQKKPVQGHKYGPANQLDPLHSHSNTRPFWPPLVYLSICRSYICINLISSSVPPTTRTQIWEGVVGHYIKPV